MGWRDDDYFIRRASYTPWGLPAPVLSFHRPMRDYVAACKRCGLELRDIDEPEPSAEAERELPASRVRQLRRMPVSYVVKCVRIQPVSSSTGDSVLKPQPPVRTGAQVPREGAR